MDNTLINVFPYESQCIKKIACKIHIFLLCIKKKVIESGFVFCLIPFHVKSIVKDCESIFFLQSRKKKVNESGIMNPFFLRIKKKKVN